MTTRKKSNAIKELEKIRKNPLGFKDLLHSIRTTEEMSQVELAELSCTSKAKICDFEKGKRVPSLDLGAKLAKALGHSEVLFVSKLIEGQIKDAKLNLKIKVEAA
jgi:transcriptional regulator with XRE-family HTH domain